jgi:hypothetical protein
MTLKNITPAPTFLDDEDDMGDYYSRKGCDSKGCESTISTYLVEVEGTVSSLCNWHYYLLTEVA